MKRALLVGIDTYDHVGPLGGCVNDVNSLLPLVARHQDDSPNFSCQPLTSDDSRIDRAALLGSVDALLAPGADVALLYFAGHGAAARNDVALVTQEGTQRDPGVPLSSILTLTTASTIPEIILVLDCCFSGAAGGVPQLGIDAAMLRPGVSILTASRGDQLAAEIAGRGAFSLYLCGGLLGGAADVLGKVTIAGLYAYLSECFGPWDQRPTFKANVDRLHDLRRCAPAVPLSELRQLRRMFSSPTSLLALDSSYEPTADPRDTGHEADFLILQRCRAAKLIDVVGAEHLYFAAMQSKACRLTPLGQLYWMLADQGRL